MLNEDKGINDETRANPSHPVHSFRSINRYHLSRKSIHTSGGEDTSLALTFNNCNIYIILVLMRMRGEAVVFNIQ